MEHTLSPYTVQNSGNHHLNNLFCFYQMPCCNGHSWRLSFLIQTLFNQTPLRIFLIILRDRMNFCMERFRITRNEQYTVNIPTAAELTTMKRKPFIRCFILTAWSLKTTLSKTTSFLISCDTM